MTARRSNVRRGSERGLQGENQGDETVARMHERYHAAQGDGRRKTAAKRLARAAGLDYVDCPCGERFRLPA